MVRHDAGPEGRCLPGPESDVIPGPGGRSRHASRPAPARRGRHGPVLPDRALYAGAVDDAVLATVPAQRAGTARGWRWSVSPNVDLMSIPGDLAPAGNPEQASIPGLLPLRMFMAAEGS